MEITAERERRDGIHSLVQRGIESFLDCYWAGFGAEAWHIAGAYEAGDAEDVRAAFAASYVGTHGAAADDAREALRLAVRACLADSAMTDMRGCGYNDCSGIMGARHEPYGWMWSPLAFRQDCKL